MTGIPALAFTRRAFGINSSSQPEWWRRPKADQKKILIARGGLTPDQLSEMTLEGWSIARHDEREERFSARITEYPRRFKAGRAVPVCGRCLSENEPPHLHRDWMIGWVAVCPHHRSVLTRVCPSCDRKLVSRGIREKDIVDIGACPRCGALLTGGDALPAMDIVIKLQAAMLAVKRMGIGEIPGLGTTEWRTVILIIDLVLKAAWIKADVHVREDLFARIVFDLGLDPNQRLLIDWRGNYGALIQMAWMLADLPRRLRQMLELLNAPTVEDILAELPDVDEAAKVQVLRAVGCAREHQPQPVKWRLWLAELVAGGIDFRALALAERNWPRRDRLVALALLSEGHTIKETATEVRVSTNMVTRWLEIGTAYGLDAVTAKSLRICDLATDQKEQIAGWLRESQRTQSGPSGWTREQARSEIAAQFGLLITTNAAYQLLLQNRPHLGRQ
jgi:transposase/ribosomal protein L37AE/L43A